MFFFSVIGAIQMRYGDDDYLSVAFLIVLLATFVLNKRTHIIK